MDKKEKVFMNRKLSITHLHEKFRDLYEEERLALFNLEMFTPELDQSLREWKLSVQELDILESHGIWLLSDVMVFGWQHNDFIYSRAKKTLSEIKGIGPKTIDILMEKICEILTTREQEDRIAEVVRESKYPGLDQTYFHIWAKRLCQQYEEIKQRVKLHRREQRRSQFKI